MGWFANTFPAVFIRTRWTLSPFLFLKIILSSFSKNIFQKGSQTVQQQYKIEFWRIFFGKVALKLTRSLFFTRGITVWTHANYDSALMCVLSCKKLFMCEHCHAWRMQCEYACYCKPGLKTYFSNRCDGHFLLLNVRKTTDFIVILELKKINNKRCWNRHFNI